MGKGLWDDGQDTPTDNEVGVDNPYLINHTKALDLVVKLMSTQMPDGILNNEIREFKRYLDEDYHRFASQEMEDLPGEAEAHDNLEEVHSILENLAECSDFAVKRMVSVAGGFSSGKSSFLNSLLGLGEVLPVETRPTTVIPTYVCLGKSKRIVALNYFGIHVELDSDAFMAISHQFKDTYGMSFTKILKHVILNAENVEYQHLLFIDTPGYTKSDACREIDDNTDEKTAHEKVLTADALIWLMDIENGTVQDTDIQFLRNIEKTRTNIGKDRLPIYFVFNKSDKKDTKSVKDVCKAAIPIIKDNGFAIAGLSAYSAHDDKETIFEGNGIKAFLKSLDCPQKDRCNLKARVKNVFHKYRKHNAKRVEDERGILGVFNKFGIADDDENLAHQITYRRQLIKGLLNLQPQIDKLEKKLLDKLSAILSIISKHTNLQTESSKPERKSNTDTDKRYNDSTAIPPLLHLEKSEDEKEEIDHVEALSLLALLTSFVKKHEGIWNHKAWLELCEELKERGYKPAEFDKVGLLLEGLKVDFFNNL